MIARGVPGSPRSAPSQKSDDYCVKPALLYFPPRARPIGPPDQTEDSKI